MRLCAWLVATLGRLLNADIRNDFLAQLLADLSDEIRRGIPSRIRDHFVLSDLVGNLIDLSLIFRQFITDDLLQLIDGRRRRLREGKSCRLWRIVPVPQWNHSAGYALLSKAERWTFAGRLSGESAMSLGAILVIILIIFLLGGFSGRFGGYGYGMGHSGMGLGGVILVVLLILLLLGKL